MGFMGWIACLAAVLGGTGADLELARQRIARMSPSQFERLQANFAAFQSLPTEEQARLRRLHLDLAAPGPEGARSDLEQTLTRLGRWLETLTPAQKQGILATNSTDERLAEIRRLVEEQNQQIVKDLRPLSSPPERDEPPGEGGPRWSRRFRGFGMASALKNLEPKLLPLLDETERQRLKSLGSDDYNHRLALLLSLREKYADQLPGAGLPPQARDALLGPVAHLLSLTLGIKPREQMSADEEAQLRRLIHDILLFPDVDPRRELEFVEGLDPRTADALNQIQSRSARTYPLILRALYYRDHPNDLTGELAGAFQRLPATMWIERRGSAAPPPRPPFPPGGRRPDRDRPGGGPGANRSEFPGRRPPPKGLKDPDG